MNELHILNTLLPDLPRNESVIVGAGDDCAVLDAGGGRKLLAAVDQLIGDVHYYADRTAPESAGAKLVKRNLSDIAAMGGLPRWALLTLAVNGRDDDWLLRFSHAVAAEAASYGVMLVGGDLAAMPPSCRGEVAALTIIGETPPDGSVLLRCGASPGDELWVTGTLGNSLGSGHHLRFRPRLEEGRFLTEHRISRCAIDISDGLLLDAARVAESSGVCMRIDASLLPLRRGAHASDALSDGEDYELLFSVPHRLGASLSASWPGCLAPVTRIGSVMARRDGLKVCDADGNDWFKQEKTGYVHQ